MSMNLDDIPQNILKLAAHAQDSAEAECIRERYVYGFGTGNAKTVLDMHIARAIMTAVEEEREKCARIAYTFPHESSGPGLGEYDTGRLEAAAAIRNRQSKDG